MGYLAPGALWLFVTLPLILVFYFLKLKRRERTIPSTLLWERLVRDDRVNAPFARLRRTIPLLLQLLAAALLALAAARPYIRSEAPLAPATVIVIDTSASMNAGDVPEGTRIEAAKERASAAISRLPPGGVVGLVEAGLNPRVASPLTDDPGGVREALATVESSGGGSDIYAALEMARSMVTGYPDAEIILLSDGAGVDLSSLPDEGAPVRFEPVGTDEDNIGITALDVRRIPEGIEAYAEVSNSGSSAETARLETRWNGDVVEVSDLDLPPAERRGIVLPIEVNGGGRLSLSLAGNEDLLPDDDDASIEIPEERSITVELLSPGDPFLRTALDLIPGIRIVRVSPRDPLDPGAVHVLDGLVPEDAPPGRYLAMGAAGGDLPWETTGIIERPRILRVSRTDPIVRGTGLSEVSIREAERINLPPYLEPLADGRRGPLVAAGEGEGYRAVVLAFRPSSSDLPLRVGFPLLVTQAMEYLTADLMAPDPSGSLLDPRETFIGPSDTVTIGTARTRSAGPVVVEKEFALLGALVALAALLLEWWIYHRRTFS